MDNVWMTRSRLSQDDFKPFEDYLGLSNLVKNLSLNLNPDQLEPMYDSHGPVLRSRSMSSSNGSSTSSEELDDFRLNGVDVATIGPEGFQPFQPTSTRKVTRPRMRRTPTWCVFCKNNQESEMVYGSHILKDSEGRTTCPILRNYTCPICGVSGDGAHTIKYCPLNKEESLDHQPSASLLRTPRISTGKKRSELLFPSGLTSRVN